VFSEHFDLFKLTILRSSEAVDCLDGDAGKQVLRLQPFSLNNFPAKNHPLNEFIIIYRQLPSHTHKHSIIYIYVIYRKIYIIRVLSIFGSV